MGFDPNTPNVARMYDYYLGGKDHFPADREAAEQILRIVPEARLAARANRAFLGRAVRHLAGLGIRQFLDIGTGLPNQGAVHEVADSVAGGSRVVYVDLDPVVLVHARAMLDGEDKVAVQGDLRKPQEILDHPDVRKVLDFRRPVAVLLVAVMHFVQESENPREIIRTLREAMAPGSYLVLSHGVSESRPDAVAEGTEVYSKATSPLVLRDRAGIAALFEGFELLEPGLVWLPEWRPGDGDTIDFIDDPSASLGLCGVARRN
ncbi:SAM-dependent methyltransferase [Nonomuraea sp. MCN248]|uniref:SAM-dependent methyltransferase n=1 Tax=Nonomuraea corallina TaxID=2989783 RepID=A0ABT4SF17_9ACTN|nr:SAM-dependent methyltransferase [Nonomuraea corallina]MDA0635797.1 SAM-dependent methyltransferase [Nonomuraea corallina]